MVLVTSKRFFLKLFIMHLIGFVLIGIFSYYSIVEEKYNEETGHYTVNINFLVPMNKKSFEEHFTIEYEVPKERPNYSVSWLSAYKVSINFLDNKSPRGQLIVYNIKGAKSLIPLINKYYKGEFRVPAKPKLANLKKIKNISSKEPLQFNFNTPMKGETIKEKVTVIKRSTRETTKGLFQPVKVKIDGKNYLDKSRWYFIPDKGFENGQEYVLRIEEGLISEGNYRMEDAYEVVFSIANKPIIIQSRPSDKDKGIGLYPTIEIKADQFLKSAVIALRRKDGQESEIPGETLVKENKIIFIPKIALLPSSDYILEGHARSIHNEESDNIIINFSTKDLTQGYWIDVKLGDIHTVIVYKGQEVIRHMVASGGKEESKTPLGTFYIGDRGYSFWSQKFNEGALYWVRVVGQILFHSVPLDSSGNIKEEEHAKLGLPASHGCIRLDDKDAKWFFENIPAGTPVIVHK